eukprot:GHVN01066088.1.p1 GENE.GHVN01066088.1~~GHVN01066088.1.p1  ORF type:complete len:1064 (-),score=81.06 GHVN01066088.1:270-3461(-)
MAEPSETPQAAPESNAESSGKEGTGSKECFDTGCFHRIQHAFGCYAVVVYDHPWLVIFLCIIATLVLGVGCLLATPEKNAEALYALPNSRAKTDRDLMKDTFGPPGRVSAVFLMSDTIDPDSGDRAGLMSRDILTRLSDFDREIREEIRAENSTTGKMTVSYQDVCYKDAWDDCQSMSILDMYQQPAQYGRPLSTYEYPLIVNRRSQKVYKSDVLLAKPTIESMPFTSGRTRTMVYNATGLAFVYYARDDPDVRQEALSWEAALVNYVLSTSVEGVDMTINAQRSWEDELVASTALKARDFFDYSCAFVLVCVYAVTVNLSRNLYRTKALSSVMGAVAALMGFAAGGGLCYYCGLSHAPTMNATPFLVLGIGLDDMFVILNSYSLTFLQPNSKERARVTLMDAGIAISVTTATNLLGFSIGAISPYLAVRNFCIISVAGLLGGYIMALTFFFAFLTLEARREERESYFLPRPTWPPWKADPDSPPIALGDGNIGAMVEASSESTSRTVNSDSLYESHQGSHASSSKTDTLPAHVARKLSSYELVARQIRHFEYKLSAKQRESSGGNIIDPAGVTEKQKSAAKRRNKQGLSTAPFDGVENIDTTGDQGDQGHQGPCLPARRRLSAEADRLSYIEPNGNPGKCYRWVFLRLGFLGFRKLWVKIMIVIAFASYLGLAIWQCTKLKPGLPFHDLTPVDSYLREAYDVSINNFDIFMLESFVFFPQKTPWWEAKYQRDLEDFNQIIMDADYTNDAINGMQMFLNSEYGETIDGNETMFHQSLREWLESPIGRNVKDSFVLDEDGKLSAWRMRIFNPFFDDTFAQSQYMVNIRADCDSFKESFDAHPYQDIFVFFESDVTIFKTTLINMGAAFLGITLISMLGLKGKRSVILVMAMIFMVNIGLFGFMDFLDLQLNILTQIFLILSIGFSVDYTVHIVHTFTECMGRSREHRMIETLVLMGTPVTHGALSTWLAMVPLIFRREYILELFFRMISLVLLFGLSHGVILLPVLLSWVGKMTDHSLEDSSSTSLEDRKLPPSAEKTQGKQKQAVASLPAVEMPGYTPPQQSP